MPLHIPPPLAVWAPGCGLSSTRRAGPSTAFTSNKSVISRPRRGVRRLVCCLRFTKRFAQCPPPENFKPLQFLSGLKLNYIGLDFKKPLNGLDTYEKLLRGNKYKIPNCFTLSTTKSIKSTAFPSVIWN